MSRRLAWSRSMLALALALALGVGVGVAVAACGGGSSGDDDPGNPDANVGTPDGGSQVDAGAGSFRLIASDFTLGADGDEKWQCERKTMTEDVWITRFTPIAPDGTHHTLLAIDNDPEADGTSDCQVSIERDWTVLFASGLGSPPLNMPDGVAVHIAAGQQIVLNLHLYNFTSAPLNETSAIDVITTDPAGIDNEAQVILVGPLSFNFSTVGENFIDSSCTMSGNTNFFAVFPHMHQLGSHAQVDLTIGGVTQTVYDEPYDFEQQWFREYDPIPMHSGDQITMHCTYYNPEGRFVQFGESSDSEMCFAISYRFPPLGGTLGNICLN